MANTNKCPHPACDKQKPTNQYSCKAHWFSLPQEIRDKIWKGYKTSADLWLEGDEEAQAYWLKRMPKDPNQLELPGFNQT